MTRRVRVTAPSRARRHVGEMQFSLMRGSESHRVFFASENRSRFVDLSAASDAPRPLMRARVFCIRPASRRLIAADPQLRRRGTAARQVRCSRLVEIHAEHRALARARDYVVGDNRRARALGD